VIATVSSGLEIEVQHDNIVGEDDDLPQLPVNRTASSPSRQAQSQQELAALRTARRTGSIFSDPGARETVLQAPAVLGWQKDRDAALSELSFRADVFVRSTIYEIPPVQVAFWLVWAIEGRAEALNRFWFVNGCGPSLATCLLLVPLLDHLLYSWVVFAICWYYQSALPPTAVYETVGYIAFPLLCRAVTLGVKYAMFADVVLSNEVPGSIRGQEYRDHSMQTRSQMTSFISNADGRQKEGLVKLLYASCLCANTDLSCASLTWAEDEDQRPASDNTPGDGMHGQGPRPDEDRTTMLPQEPVGKGQMIQAMWEDLAAMLAGVADARHAFTQLDSDHSGDLCLPGIHTSTPPCQTSPPPPLQESHAADRDNARDGGPLQSWRRRRRLCRI